MSQAEVDQAHMSPADNDERIREREIAVKEAELSVKQQELGIKRDEAARSRWSNPLVVSLLAAAAAAGGNAVISFVNGQQSEALENERAESTRILEMIKTGGPDSAAENLRFLVDAGLIENKVRLTAIRNFLSTRAKGTGPSLPSPGTSVVPLSKTVKSDGVYAPITYVFRAKDKDIQYNDLDFEFRHLNGDVISRMSHSRILGGAFKVIAGQSHSFSDNIYVPPDVCSSLNQPDNGQVDFYYKFHGTDSDNKSVDLDATIRIAC